MRLNRSPLAAVVLVALLAGASMAACGDDDTGGASTLTLTRAWARTSPSVANAGAAYVTITNGTDAADALVAARIDPAVAKSAEIHETVVIESPGTGDMPATTAAGAPMMEMRPVARVEIPAKSSVEFKPGGYHMMLMELARPLQVGTTFELTLTFEHAGDKVVTIDVRDAAP